jgi:hypothetical protein
VLAVACNSTHTWLARTVPGGETKKRQRDGPLALPAEQGSVTYAAIFFCSVAGPSTAMLTFLGSIDSGRGTESSSTPLR